MTIETIALRNDYVGNGSQTVFAFTFKVLFEVAESPAYSIQVITTDLLGVETIKTQITDYTITLNSNNTGTITFSTAPITGHKITLLRSVSKTQRADYVNAGTDKFPGNVHELALDKLTLISQEYLEKFNRVITLPKNSLLSNVEFPIDATRADQVLVINSAGNNLTTKNLADVELAPVTNFIKTLLDDIDAATARNTLGAQAQSANLLALAGLVGAANKVPYFTGAGAMALTDPAVQATESLMGIAEIATQAETNAGTDDSRMVTPLKLKTNIDSRFVNSKVQNGYTYLPNGLILQWGFKSATGGTMTITFPIAFPTACLNVISQLNANTQNYQSTTIGSLTTTQFTLYWDNAAIGVFWFAIGY